MSQQSSTKHPLLSFCGTGKQSVALPVLPMKPSTVGILKTQPVAVKHNCVVVVLPSSSQLIPGTQQRAVWSCWLWRGLQSPDYLSHQKSPLKHNHQTQKAEFVPFPDPRTNDFNQKGIIVTGNEILASTATLRQFLGSS